uniref:IQ motif containing B1 n=1 Tax=Seriola lalandi dorsalis TaxID=1841481 RepID=A0A3B4XGC1_SERLL
AAVQTDSSVLTRVKSQLYHTGVLSQCVRALSLDPIRLRGNWTGAANIVRPLSSCCVGVDPGKHSKAFHRLFLPSVIDSLLSLASQLMRRVEVRRDVPSSSLFRKVMDSVSWLLRAHTQLTTQGQSSHSYDDSVLLLLNEAVGQLAVSSDSVVGRASVRLILLMANQLQLRLDNLLDKDWRGQGFDQEVDQLIALIQSDRVGWRKVSTEHVRAACVIQAAWRSYQTRRRVKSLSRAVSTLQRRYRYLTELQSVCVRRQQARRAFHQKQRQLLQLLPPDQVQSYLQECERRAAVVIQSFWRGFRERRRYNNTHRHTLRHTRSQQQAARTLQRAVRHFLQERRAAKAPPVAPFWIGQKGLTDSRRAELKAQLEDYIAAHPSSHVSPEECQRLHEEVQLLLLSALQRGEQRRREEQRMEALLAHTHTQLELLRDAPPLSVVTATDAESFLSLSGPVAARARDAHNARLQTSRLPWWRTLGEPVDVFTPAHLQDLEAELGGLFVGGSAEVSKLTEVDRLNL